MNIQQKMPEAEVSLRLAFYLIRSGLAKADVHVAIDGAQVRTTNTIHFGIAEFLKELGWLKALRDDIWQGEYSHSQHQLHRVIIHSNPGRGDVVAELIDGRTLRVESKKGPLS